MKKTILTVYGKTNEGKSLTVKNICRLIVAANPNTRIMNLLNNQQVNPNDIDFEAADLEMIMDLGEYKIGLNGSGDPDTGPYLNLETLVNSGCEMIIRTSTAKNDLTRWVDVIAHQYQYDTIWTSTYYSPGLNFAKLNVFASISIWNLIQTLARS